MDEAQRALRTYLDHLAVERGLAGNTLASYRRDLRRYLRFLQAQGVSDLADVGEQTVSEFLMHLRDGDGDHPPLSASSAGRAVVAVRGLHRFAVTDGWTKTDPAAAVYLSNGWNASNPGSGSVTRRRLLNIHILLLQA